MVHGSCVHTYLLQLGVMPNHLHHCVRAVTMNKGSKPILQGNTQSAIPLNLILSLAITISSVTTSQAPHISFHYALTFLSPASTRMAFGKTRAVLCLLMDVTSFKLMFV